MISFLKNIFININLLFNIALIVNSIASDNIFYLNKNNIINEAKNNSAAIENIKAKFLASKLDKSQYLENFQPNLTADASYFKTNESNFIEYAPVASPVSSFAVGAKKILLQVFLLVYTTILKKEKYGKFGSDAYNYVSIEFTMDLYKNLFGKDSKSRILYLKYQEDLAKIQKEIDIEIFLISVFRKYLEILLNHEAIKVSQKILENYKVQEMDMKKRYKDGIADLSDVKRSSSQVSMQNVNILNLINKEELLFLDLRNLLPSISGKKIEISDYDIKNYDNYFSKIISIISNNKSMPLNYTKYDDALKILYKSYKKEMNFTDNYDNLDLEFYSSYNHFGNNSTNKKALQDINKDPRVSYETGIRLNIPLGNKKTDSKDTMILAQKSAFLAQKRQDMAKIESYHLQSINNIAILRKSQKFQKQNSLNLKEISVLSKKKYKQARISIRDLIDDQDLYFQSILKELEIKSIMMNQILDYMIIFTKTPFALSDG